MRHRVAEGAAPWLTASPGSQQRSPSSQSPAWPRSSRTATPTNSSAPTARQAPTARLLPFTVDGLIWAASMVILDASGRKQPAPALAKWSLAVGIVATVGANVAHGASHGAIGGVVSAWPALALVGSFELLMTLTRNSACSGLVQDKDVSTGT
ncbi:DUF2637 domain-containing protein [Actinomadura terrae]|uniref:DUF2637 domain-containing protein n=1 Tax=Actinomadura terrae TaxID=604353 RepID=UPI003557B4AA